MMALLSLLAVTILTPSGLKAALKTGALLASALCLLPMVAVALAALLGGTDTLSHLAETVLGLLGEFDGPVDIRHLAQAVAQPGAERAVLAGKGHRVQSCGNLSNIT